MRLTLARTLAWALLVGGWWQLGLVGRQHLPLLAGGLAPLALWLLVTGVSSSLLAGRRLPVAALRALLPALGLAAAGGLLAGREGWGLLALAWAGLLVAASLVVRACREQALQRPPAPIGPAASGVMLAMAMPAGPAAVAAAVAGASLLLAALLPRRPRVTACRAGLFDCAWPLPAAAGWAERSAWPIAAARLAMLPMMATLAAMNDWCSALPVAPAAMPALHALGMLGPALLLQWAVRSTGRLPSPLGGPAAPLALLVAGAFAGWTWPGPPGWLAASLLQGMAWSLAWSVPLLRPATAGAAVAPPGPFEAVQAAALVLALGAAMAVHGPAALLAAQAGLALLGLAALPCRRPARRAQAPHAGQPIRR